MISRRTRFHGHGSLNYVYRHGEIVRSQLFAVKYILNNKRKAHRVAVVVSKKVAKSAVTRNRIRRRLFEQVRLLEPRIQRPYDIVITVYLERVSSIESAELSATLTELFTEAGILD